MFRIALLVLLVAVPATAKDALLDYTNAKADKYAVPYTTRMLASFPAGSGIARLVGYSNTEKASHVSWGTVWYLLTPQGNLYQVTNLTQAGGQVFAGEHDGHKGVAIHFNAINQGVGFDATATIYSNGKSFRFHREEHEFNGYGDSLILGEVKMTDGALKLKAAPRELVKAVPAANTFPALKPYPKDRSELDW